MFESHQLDVLGIWRLYSTASSPPNTSAYAIWSLSQPSSCEMLGATMQDCKYLTANCICVGHCLTCLGICMVIKLCHGFAASLHFISICYNFDSKQVCDVNWLRWGQACGSGKEGTLIGAKPPWTDVCKLVTCQRYPIVMSLFFLRLRGHCNNSCHLIGY